MVDSAGRLGIQDYLGIAQVVGNIGSQYKQAKFDEDYGEYMSILDSGKNPEELPDVDPSNLNRPALTKAYDDFHRKRMDDEEYQAAMRAKDDALINEKVQVAERGLTDAVSMAQTNPKAAGHSLATALNVLADMNIEYDENDGKLYVMKTVDNPDGHGTKKLVRDREYTELNGPDGKLDWDAIYESYAAKESQTQIQNAVLHSHMKNKGDNRQAFLNHKEVLDEKGNVVAAISFDNKDAYGNPDPVISINGQEGVQPYTEDTWKMMQAKGWKIRDRKEAADLNKATIAAKVAQAKGAKPAIGSEEKLRNVLMESYGITAAEAMDMIRNDKLMKEALQAYLKRTEDFDFSDEDDIAEAERLRDELRINEYFDKNKKKVSLGVGGPAPAGGAGETKAFTPNEPNTEISGSSKQLTPDNKRTIINRMAEIRAVFGDDKAKVNEIIKKEFPNVQFN
jgi:hypothetical protein